MEFSFHLQKIKETWHARHKTNLRYSLRAYARDLGIDPSTLLKVLRKERNFPLGYLEQVLERLKLNNEEQDRFRKSVLRARGLVHKSETKILAQFSLTQQLHFRIIAEWEYYTLLNLTSCVDFQSNVNWIAERMQISIQRCEEVISVLLKVNLLHIDSKGNYRRLPMQLMTEDEVASLALRMAHQREMTMAIEAQNFVPLDQRDFCSMTFGINKKNLKKAKKLTRQYFQEMSRILEEGPKTDVYQLSLQLFPLTKKSQRNSKCN